MSCNCEHLQFQIDLEKCLCTLYMITKRSREEKRKNIAWQKRCHFFLSYQWMYIRIALLRCKTIKQTKQFWYVWGCYTRIQQMGGKISLSFLLLLVFCVHGCNFFFFLNLLFIHYYSRAQIHRCFEFQVFSWNSSWMLLVCFFHLDMNIHTSAIKVHNVHEVVCLRCLFCSIENRNSYIKRREKNWHVGKRRIKCLVDSVDIVVGISAASRTDSWLVDWLNRGVGIWQCHANSSSLTNSNALHLLCTTCLI